ncbi:MAG: type III pantothenate kinase [Clostridia bacterium]|nr:type III pantothenate kinase [Clostridia bacterium]MBQ7052062.1 type III pantothenate kinase [Clostridia bacterium]
MIFVMDIGNTNIKAAVFDGRTLLRRWRCATDPSMTSDQYGIIMADLFRYHGLDMRDIEGIMISSVVPTINFTIEHMCGDYFGMEPRFLVPGMKTGLNIRYENPRELGSDRIANAVAVSTLYGGPSIFIDFGTATTYGVISEKNEFLGGAIGPGLRMMNKALATGTAKLPSIELVVPPRVIGRTTVTNIQSGVLYGYIGSVEKLVGAMKKEIGALDTKVIATGGMAHIVRNNSDVIDEINPDLTLTGLRIIYEKNQA